MMDNDKLIEEFKRIILQSLLDKDLINQEIYDKCKPHIQSLPYDNRVNDTDKLQKREDAINERIEKAEQDIKDLQKENDKLEATIYDLDKKIEESDKKLSDYGDEINSRLNEASTDLEEAQEDIVRDYGTEQDSRDEWYNRGIGEEFDYINQEINRINEDIDNVMGKLFDSDGAISLDSDSLSREYNPYLNASRSDIRDLKKYMEDATKNAIDSIPDALDGNIGVIQGVYDNLFVTQDVFADYDSEKSNNIKLTSDRDSLQVNVDDNNLDIGKIEEMINDYRDELDKI